jgi:GT2 family glycosyltransferase
MPVFNGIDYTKQCIREILLAMSRSGTDPSHNPIIVIDDGSTDGTAEWIMNNYPIIHIVKGDGNLWWSGAINKGIEYSLQHLDITYVLLWNNDITPCSDYFKIIAEIINSAEAPLIACSMVYFKSRPDTLISTGGFFNRKNGKKILYNFNVTESKAQYNNLKIDWFGGMGTLISTKVFQTIGYFDQVNFPQYHGDCDFGIRATLSGYDIRLVPGMKILNDTAHSGVHTLRGFRNLINSFSSIKSNYNIRMDIKFYRKYTLSPLAYNELFKKYFIYIASYVYWRVLTFFGISKK